MKIYKLLKEINLIAFLREIKHNFTKSQIEINNSEYFSSIIFRKLSEKNCPICSDISIFGVQFSYDWDAEINKNICLCCGHLFSAYEFNFLGSNSYDFEQYYPFGEAKIAAKAISLRGGRNGHGKIRLLFIGSGGNQGLLHSYLKSDIEVFYTDLKQVSEDIKFIPNQDLEEYAGFFDIICSRAVVEHLEDSLDTFKKWRNILKKDGIMAHSFPCLYHNDLNNPMIGIRSHTNIFSKNSLYLLCEKLGLKIINEAEPFLYSGYTHPTYFFIKNSA